MAEKNITILGATGSIGRSTLAIAGMFPQRFRIRALTAKNNIDVLADQINRFQPDLAVIYESGGIDRLKSMLDPAVRTEIMSGKSGYEAAATLESVDTVVSAM